MFEYPSGDARQQAAKRQLVIKVKAIRFIIFTI